ncbi:MAG: F0F1 ATP synthase subunit alpha, partial [Alphaproteobacteria bacterium]
RELAAFAQFGSDLDAATQKQLSRGARLTEVLKQKQYEPVPIEKQVLILWAATSGYVDDLPVEQVGRFERELFSFVEGKHPQLLADIKAKRELTDDLKKQAAAVLDDFKKAFVA